MQTRDPDEIISEKELLELMPKDLTDADKSRVINALVASTNMLASVHTRATVAGLVTLILGVAFCSVAYYIGNLSPHFIPMIAAGTTLILSTVTFLMSGVKIGDQPFEFSPWDPSESDMAMAIIDVNREIRECSGWFLFGAIMATCAPLVLFVFGFLVSNGMV